MRPHTELCWGKPIKRYTRAVVVAADDDGQSVKMGNRSLGHFRFQFVPVRNGRVNNCYKIILISWLSRPI